MKICLAHRTLVTMDTTGSGTWYSRVSGLWNTMAARLNTAAGGIATLQRSVTSHHTHQRDPTRRPQGTMSGDERDLRWSYVSAPAANQSGVRVRPEGGGNLTQLHTAGKGLGPLEECVDKLGPDDLVDNEELTCGVAWESVWINPLEEMVNAQYIGSFSVQGEDQNARAEYVRKQLSEMKDMTRTKAVLLVISLSGVKVCSSTGESVYMAHALKRISYATCDPEHRQFSFLAREPKGHTSVQYCHAFVTATPDQAEELNNIVGNAFKMAYAYQRQAEQAQQPTFHELIEQQLQDQKSKLEELEDHRQRILQQKLKEISTATIADRVRERKERRRAEVQDAERERAVSRLQGKDKTAWAKHEVGKSKHKAPFSDEVYQRHSMYASATPSSTATNGTPSTAGVTAASFSQSTSSISMSVLREAFEANDQRSHGSPVMALKETIDSHFNGTINCTSQFDEVDGDAYLCPVVSSETHQAADEDCPDGLYNQNHNMVNRPLPATPPGGDEKKQKKSKNTKSRKSSESRRSLVLGSPRNEESPLGSAVEMRNSDSHNYSGGSTIRPPSVRYQNHDSSAHMAFDVAGVYAISMTTPRKYDSLRKIEGPLEDEETLKQHTWYQAGIPREIALEILLQQEIGSFIVRDSTTHSGCFALSVKVPKYENPAGISHYLIHRTRNGVKLKGLDKEWPCLTALVTHHTVMPEMLPCTLRLPRNAANPTFKEVEREDREEDEDYQKLSDFSTMMAELKKL